MTDKKVLVYTVKEIEQTETDTAFRAVYFYRGGKSKELAAGEITETAAEIICKAIYGKVDMDKFWSEFSDAIYL